MAKRKAIETRALYSAPRVVFGSLLAHPYEHGLNRKCTPSKLAAAAQSVLSIMHDTAPEKYQRPPHD